MFPSHDRIGNLIVTAGLPFGFEGDDFSAGFASTVEEDNVPYTDSGTMSSLVYTSFTSQDYLYKYQLNSDTVSVIGLGSYDRPLVNIEDFRYFAIESIDPAEDVFYLSTRQSAVDDLNALFSGTKTFEDYQTPPATIYYELIPRAVQEYPIGSINFSMILGSSDNSTPPGTRNTLQIGVNLDCNSATPKLNLVVNKTNTDGTQASTIVEFTGTSNIQDKVFGIYLNPITRELGYTYNGVDQGLFLADSSNDPEITVGQPFTWSDRRAYSGFFVMEGIRTTDLLNSQGDIISMEWVQDNNQLNQSAALLIVTGKPE